MLQGNISGVVVFTELGTTIAIHPIAVGVNKETANVKTAHSLTIYSLLNEDEIPKLIVSINVSRSALGTIHEAIGLYLAEEEEHSAMADMNEELK